MAITNDMLDDFATGEVSTLEQLYQVQVHNAPSNVFLPYAHNIYDVDLKTRTINGPEVISVQRDHRAEVIYFKVDRYIDYMDLANTICVISYIIPKEGTKVPYLYAVPFYDTIKFQEENKMIFPWQVGGPATVNEGKIEYAIRFFKVDDSGTDKKLVYSLSTLPATSRILPSLEGDTEVMKVEYDVPIANGYENLVSQIIENKTYWTIL